MAETDTETAAAPAQQDVEAHVRSYFDAFARRDPKGMVEHLREDAVEDSVPLGVMRGRAEVERFLTELFAAIPDLETTVKRVITQGNTAAVEWRMEGNFTGSSFQGIDPTGKHVVLRGFDLIEVEDGLIASVTAYYDAMAFARRVGMLPPPDSAADKAMKTAFNALTKARRAIAERRTS